ncbi:MAG TPA: sigma 54-interacting transcriptional regulator [Terriglobales bacterium]|nr:sigma 54-interacting transcriptional regulator [Terriglobales bacterium]
MASPALGKQSSSNNAKQAPAAASEPSRAHWGALPPNVLDQLREPVIVCDLEGKVSGGNQAAVDFYGFSAEDLIGKSITLLCPEEQQEFFRDSVLPAAREKGHYQGELRTRTRTGKDAYVQVSMSLLCDGASTPVGIAVVLMDVTERKLLELALRQSHGKAKGAEAISPPKEATTHREINGTKFVIASPVMHKFMAMVDRVASHPEIVLITGETGSGKELIARSIHDQSSRAGKPWVDINCAALPEYLVESELFGYEKGAFSGADSSKPGLFELADKGTIFLDEIGELDLKLQVKLLRVLDGAPYYRLGGHRKITVDVRVVAATNQDLEAAVQDGRFRKDLFHRLSQFQLRVPPLRERPEDVVALAQHFLSLKNDKVQFSSDALSALACYSWPGNVRELRNLVAKLAMSSSGTVITADNLLSEIATARQPSTNAAVPVTDLEGMEEQMIIKALETTGGHRGLAAEQLGISRRTLSRKLREYNITTPDTEKGRPMGAMGADQQKFFRAKTQFLINLKNKDNEEITVTAVNLSTGGLGVDGVTDPQRFGGLLDASFLLPESETLIQAKVRLVWADAAGRAGIRFVVLDPALYQEIHHWTSRKMKEEGWDLPQR